MKSAFERLYNGIIKENPTFVLMLGMCPTLAVTTSAFNGLGMGLSTMVVLALSNLLISALRKVIPDKVRIPAYIVIVASLVTVVGLLMEAYLPGMYASLGIYIDLIVVNCIILGRAESYASKNKMWPSLFDGIGMGLGFTLALTLIGMVREFFGNASIFGLTGPKVYGTTVPILLVELVNKVFNPASSNGFVRGLNEFFAGEFGSFSPIGILVMAPGAFFVLAILTAIQNAIKAAGEAKGKDMSKIQSGCSSDCLNCSESGCARRLVEPEKVEKKAEVKAEEKAEEKAEAKAEETAEVKAVEKAEEGNEAINAEANTGKEEE
ncbi:MAG: electron transport complex subunit E [Lachnospiraceae bacterium]|nr:electron transport complex subunit E [Lachnospiraceae bacterium]